MNKIVRDAIVITSLSIILGLVYNHFSAKPFSIMPQEVKAVNDSLLNAASGANIEIGANATTVTFEQVKARIDNPEFVIIDARTPDDFAKAKIGNAINIYPYNENTNEYMQAIYTLPRDKVFIIYCNGGSCDLSHHLAEDMKTAGHQKMFIYTGGWEDWELKNK